MAEAAEEAALPVAEPPELVALPEVEDALVELAEPVC